MINMYKEWRQLTLSQFWGKKNIEGIMRAICEELQEVYEIQQQLRTLMDIDTQEGVNLDNIGEAKSLRSNLSDKQDKVPQPLYLQDININDWNNVSAQGWYSGYNSQNAPTSGWVCAINIPYNGDKDYSCLIATNGMSLYTRCRDGGTKTWTAWREFATK